MDITVAMRAHRSLRKLPRYHSASEREGLLNEAVRAVRLEVDEVAIGFYENAPQSTDKGVLITNQGLHVHRENLWTFVPYSEILSVDLEGGEKSLNVDNLEMQLRNGATELVPFVGGDSTLGTRDTFAAWTFLKNVSADMLVRKTSPAGK
jgi:hypothetical protein